MDLVIAILKLMNPVTPNLKNLSILQIFLPALDDGLADRFNQLFTEFTRQGKREHRGELMFLLDEYGKKE